MQTTIGRPNEIGRSRPVQVLDRLLNPGPTLDFHDLTTVGRSTIEAYIAQQFHAIYGANIRDFMPLFLSMNCRSQPITALGVRPSPSA